jgi:integrase/recombinase XerD
MAKPEYRKLKTYLDPEDINKLEEAANCLRDKLLIRLLYYSACRISEALPLTVQDIDFRQDSITIKHLKDRIKLSCPHCKTRISKSNKYCPGCSRKISEVTKEKLEQRRRRILPIDHETLKMLKEYIDRGGPVNRSGQLMIFGINRHRAWQIIKQCAIKVGLPLLVNPETGKEHSISPHRLRDAFAVNAVKHDDSGDGLRMLQEHLGHRSIATTMRYRKVAGEEHRDWYQRLWNKEDAD